MNAGKVIAGLIIIAVAIWTFLGLADPTAKYLAGIILLVLGLVLLFSGFKKKGPKPPEQPPAGQS